MTTSLVDGIDWVGAVDWNVRDFHGYATSRGSTYNAYLVRDEHTALIDTVKCPSSGESAGEPGTAHRSVSHRVRGGQPRRAGPRGACPRSCAPSPADLVTNKRCARRLSPTTTRPLEIAHCGHRETLSLGATHTELPGDADGTLADSMMTYVPEEKLLFSRTASGSTTPPPARFDDDVHSNEVMQEAKTYYANIIMWAGKPIAGRWRRRTTGHRDDRPHPWRHLAQARGRDLSAYKDGGLPPSPRCWYL